MASDAISNRLHVQDWVKRQTHQTKIWYALRCSLRTLPTITLEPTDSFDKIALPMLRAFMAAGSAATCKSNELARFAGICRYADTAAKQAALHTTTAAETALYSAAIASETATRSEDGASFCAESGFDSAKRSIIVAFGDQNELPFSLSAEKDIAFSGDWLPLWHDFNLSPEMKNAWKELEEIMSAHPEKWHFWQEWYQSILDGSPLSWGFGQLISQKLKESDWSKGPKHVAARIEALKFEFLAETTEMVESVEFDEANLQFYFVPREIENHGLLGASLSQVEDALSDVLSDPSNGLNDGSREVKVLRRTLTKHGNDPQRIEMDFTTVHAGLTRQIISEELPPSEENLALQRALEEGAQAIRGTHEDVAKNRKILNSQRIRELSEEQKSALAEAQPVLEAISEQAMQEDFAQDIPYILEERFRVHPVDEAVDEKRRTFSRIAKIGVLLRKTPSLVEKVEKNTAYKATRIGLTSATLIAVIVKLVSIGISIF